MSYEIVKLEDGINYLILNEQVIDNVKYLYLVNVNDEDDFAIRKEDGEDLVGLTEEEFDKVIKYIIKEINEDIE